MLPNEQPKKPFYSMLGLTIFCTILFSFVAFPGILCASKANTQFALGNHEEARRLNRKASFWCWASVLVLVLFLLFKGGDILNSFNLDKDQSKPLQQLVAPKGGKIT